MRYTVAFTFTTTNNADTLMAQLMLNGGNVISLSTHQQIRIESSSLSPTALSSLLVAQPKDAKQPSIIVQAVPNTAGKQQSVEVVVPITAEGANLTGNFPYGGAMISLQYKFIGYDYQGYISIGDFSIPFPTS